MLESFISVLGKHCGCGCARPHRNPRRATVAVAFRFRIPACSISAGCVALKSTRNSPASSNFSSSCQKRTVSRARRALARRDPSSTVRFTK